jgi:FAD/FMN-containing dehydrogenase
MSPFCNGEKISIAVHCYHREAYAAVFADVEAIFKRFGGRPHWGKMHTLTHRDLRTLYPEFEAFNRIRRALDPQGRFVNAYLAQLWGETGCA